MKILGINIPFSRDMKNNTEPTPPVHTLEMIAGRYLIDVRTLEEWQRDHIDGAILIPHDQIGQEIHGVISDKHAPIGLFCRSGRRSGMALEVLKAMGYDRAENWGSIQDARRKLTPPQPYIDGSTKRSL
jgi:phage shock protein E